MHMTISMYRPLTDGDISSIHDATLEILETVGVKVELKKMRGILSDIGCRVDEKTKVVTFPPKVVSDYVKKAPREFIISGADPSLEWPMNPEARIYGGLGTAVNMYDLDTGDYVESTRRHNLNHMILLDSTAHIHTNQTDITPNDIPMQTVHVAALRDWFVNYRNSSGMGAYGVMATTDMMEMLSIAMGGREAIEKRHPYLVIVSIQSPLSSAQMQLEGLMILAEWGQPALLSPECMAGTTAPVTLAGLLAQHNAEVLSHVVMAQAVNPGTPVIYGTVSTVSEMRRGTTALGAVETGIISASLAQMAHHYDLPCRGVAGATESKTLDVQCGAERMRSMMLAAMGGVNLITCAGTLESTTAGAHELVLIDDELASSTERALQGVCVDKERIALEVIKRVGPDGNFLMDQHTQQHFRSELLMTSLSNLDKRDIWERDGKRDMAILAREKAQKLLADHQPRELDPKLVSELDAYVKAVEGRSLEEFFAVEWEA
jgi:trimethylamine--corrinoid protein Co-methyltransferase